MHKKENAIMSVTDIENMKVVIYEDGTTDYDRMIEELAGGWDHYGLLWLRMRINMLHLDVYAKRELIKDLRAYAETFSTLYNLKDLQEFE